MPENKKIKISSDLILLKVIFITVIVFCTGILLWPGRESIKHYLIIIVILGLILFFLFTRSSIYYSEDMFFIKKWRKDEINIPLENIISIKLSFLGFSRGENSWVVKYYSDNSEIKSIRILPNSFNSFSDFIKACENKNPEIKTRRWSVGINELFD
ncbi:MAG: hypothetical protein ABIP30_10310 [Ferruginibacter sp.]